MDKREALRKFLSEKPRIKYFKKMLCTEAWEAMKAWKSDHFAPSVKEISGMDGSAFAVVYESAYDKTVQHELCEMVELIDHFLEAHGCDMMEYYEALKKYRKISEPNKTTIIYR